MRLKNLMFAASFALCVSLAACSSPPEDAAPTEPVEPRPRVMVLGIDGGTWLVLEPMMEKGELPNLKKLYDNGVHGVLESRPPVMSPVVWTTIFTGKPHEEHGVQNWKTSQTKHRKVRALWEMTSARGKSTYVFNVPGSWPPEPVDGVMLSGFPLPGGTLGGNTGIVMTREALESQRLNIMYRSNQELIRKSTASLAVGEWTPWLDITVSNRPTWTGVMRIKRLTDDTFYISPLYRTDDEFIVSYPEELRAELSEKIGGPYIPEGPGWSKWEDAETPEYLSEHLEQVFELQNKAVEQLAGDDWDLMLYVMTLVDRVSHPYWAYFEPDNYDGLDREKAAKYADEVRQSYIETDRRMGEVLAAAKGEFYVVVASDHGFQSSRNREQFIGTHEYDGIYLVSGPGLKGQQGERVFIEDIGPTVLHLLEMPVGADMQGKPIPEVSAQLGREPTTIPTYEGDALRNATDEPVDSETWEQLKGLGYVDGPAPKKGDKD